MTYLSLPHLLVATLYPSLLHCSAWLCPPEFWLWREWPVALFHYLALWQPWAPLVTENVFCGFLPAHAYNHPTEIHNGLDNDMKRNYEFSTPLRHPTIIVYHCPTGRKGGKSSTRNKLINLFLKPSLLFSPPSKCCKFWVYTLLEEASSMSKVF